jgi:predicted Ser/Thr protein kinase
VLSPGTVLSERYELTERIAAGGMGEVWRGVDLMLHRPIAVKVVLPNLMADPEFLTRFRSEARMMAALRHPGIVQVYDYGENAVAGSGRMDYMVMEFIEGTPLAKKIQDAGRLSPADTMTIVAQVADALQVAHDAGIVHRDVKPANLLVRPNGALVLVDFGVARSTNVTGITSTNVVLGSANYMAPEQAEGHPVSGLTDVYALGAVAYCCLTGRPPYVGDNPLQVLAQLVYGELPTLPPDVPPAVASLVTRALAKNPAHRFPSASAMAQAARGAGRGGPAAPHQRGNQGPGAFPPGGRASGAFPPAGRAASAGGFAAAGPGAGSGGLPPAGRGPASGAYPPAGRGPASGAYPPAGGGSASGGYSPAGRGPASGAYPPAGRGAASGGLPPSERGAASGAYPPASGAYPPAGRTQSGGYGQGSAPGTARYPGGTGSYPAGAASVPPSGYASGAASVSAPGQGMRTASDQTGSYGRGSSPAGNAGNKSRKTMIAAVAAIVVGLGAATTAYAVTKGDDTDTPTSDAAANGADPRTGAAQAPAGATSKTPKPRSTKTKTSKPTKAATRPAEESSAPSPEENPAAGTPASPTDVCGGGYKVIDTATLRGDDGVVGRVYLLFSADGQKNCVVTIKTTDLDQDTQASAFLQVEGKDRDTQGGSVDSYAGPIKAAAPGACVAWGGAIEDASAESPFEHCN